MKEKALPFERIVFICTNERDKGDRCSCGRKGAALQETLKDQIKKRGLKDKVRISKSGCVDKCELGPNVMLFPDNVWFHKVKEKDIPAILDRIVAGLDRG